MRNTAEAFEDEQTRFALSFGTAAEDIAGELNEIGRGIVAAEAELETVLCRSGCRGMRPSCSRQRERGNHGSLRKLTGAGAVKFSTLTRALADWSPALIVIAPAPSPRGVTNPSLSTLAAGSFDRIFDDRRRSRIVPSAYLPVTTSCAGRSGAVERDRLGLHDDLGGLAEIFARATASVGGSARNGPTAAIKTVGGQKRSDHHGKTSWRGSKRDV